MGEPLTPANIPVTGYDRSAMGKPIQQGDWFALCLPFDGYVLLSGGASVRTNVTTIQGDETWMIDWRSNFTGSYGPTIGLEMPSYNNYYLSGGPSGVRTNVTHFQGDEEWQLLSAEWTSQRPITYGSFVSLQMPVYDNLLLSGGPSGVRTNATHISLDEIWQILKITR